MVNILLNQVTIANKPSLNLAQGRNGFLRFVIAHHLHTDQAVTLMVSKELSICSTRILFWGVSVINSTQCPLKSGSPVETSKIQTSSTVALKLTLDRSLNWSLKFWCNRIKLV